MTIGGAAGCNCRKWASNKKPRRAASVSILAIFSKSNTQCRQKKASQKPCLNSKLKGDSNGNTT